MTHPKPSSGHDQAQALFRAAFDKPRDPRSEAYKAGVLAALRYRCQGVRSTCPFAIGAAEADAYFAGSAEGHAIWREAQQQTATLTARQAQGAREFARAMANHELRKAREYRAAGDPERVRAALVGIRLWRARRWGAQ